MPSPLEELESSWELRIARASEEDRPGLEVQKRDAIIAHQRQESAERERSDWVRDAIAQFPSADPDAVRGSTKEEILAVAERSHKRAEELKEQTKRELGQQQYGGGGAPPPGSGNQPPPTDADKDDAYLQKELSRVRGQLATPSTSDPGPLYNPPPPEPGDPVGAPTPEMMSRPEGQAYIRWRMRRRFSQEFGIGTKGNTGDQNRQGGDR